MAEPITDEDLRLTPERMEQLATGMARAFTEVGQAAQKAAIAMVRLRGPLREVQLAMRHHRLSRGARRHLRRQKAARG